MLSCVTDCEQICSNPSNNSNSKHLFSFPRGPRFLHYKKAYNDNIYESQSDFRKMRNFGERTSFGVARPELFSQKEQIQKPPPDSYMLKSAFVPLNYAGISNKKRSATAKRSRQNLINAAYNDQAGTTPQRVMHTFGVARSAYNNVVSPSKHNYQPHDRTLPGPGYYQNDPNSAIGATSKYTMAPKTSKERK